MAELNATVATDRGRVRGAPWRGRDGEVAGGSAFLGLPYAASPLGALRFAPPTPHPGWADERDATAAGPSAPQGPSRLELVMGARAPDWSEDGCLTLNVWRPAAATGRDGPRPVLVWFHGGGFSSGSGGWDWYDGARLAELGHIVVVTANYRLGPLGFLHLPEIGADNLGHQDQAAALHWVAANIAAFGGDPSLVTVGGQSAGAFSAMQLALAPETRGLVRRVLLQSGPWGAAPLRREVAEQVTRDYLGALGVRGRGAAAGPALRELPVAALLAEYAVLAKAAAVPGSITPPMFPVLGGALLSREWEEAVADGALGDIDVLVGANSDEGSAFYSAEGGLGVSGDDEARRVLVDLLGADGAAATAVPGRLLTETVTERVFGAGVRDLARYRAAQGRPAYVYRFERPSPEHETGLGTPHCAELPFLFGTLEEFSGSLMSGELIGERGSGPGRRRGRSAVRWRRSLRRARPTARDCPVGNRALRVRCRPSPSRE
jgi:para-nitrobenzyl esterase